MSDTFGDVDCDKVREAARNRKIARERAAGTELGGYLAELEQLGEPFYLGLDYDPDDEDIDILPY